MDYFNFKGNELFAEDLKVTELAKQFGTPLYVYSQRGTSKDDWIKFEKYEDGYLIKVNFDNQFINDNFNTQASKAASNAIAIVLATSMLQAQDLGLKLSDSSKLLKMINEIMGDNNG